MKTHLNLFLTLSLIIAFLLSCEKKDPVINVTSVSISKPTLALTEGDTESLSATISPNDATNKKVNWSSSKSDVASVDNSGKVTALKAGEATITATSEDGSKSATCVVTVSAKHISVTTIALNKSTLALTEGDTESLSATISPNDATNKKVNWSSNKSDVASVDNSGKVTALKAGEATITATSEDGSKSATCVVTVSAKHISVTTIALNKSTLALTEGDTESLSATISPNDATNKKVNWSSNKSDVASVDNSGKVTALKAGEATITATSEDGSKSATCVVTVSAKHVPVTAVSLNFSVLSIGIGETKQLVATITPTNASNKKVTWSSSKSSVATVDANGVVEAIATGDTQIIATTEDGAKQAICNVSVVQAEAKFFKDGIYYVATAPGATSVNVTHKGYGVYNFNGSTDNSYSGSITIPSSVEYNGLTYSITGVDIRAFFNCKNLTSVVLSEGIVEIGSFAFTNNANLETLHLPTTLAYINDANSVFDGSSKLKISVASGSHNFKIIDDALYKFRENNGKTEYYLIWIPEYKTGEISIVAETKTLGHSSIKNAKISKIEIPKSVTTFYAYLFSRCNNLTDISLNWNNSELGKLIFEKPVTSFYFNGIVYTNITLSVPKGTKAAYEAHALWGLGFKIVEREQ